MKVMVIYTGNPAAEREFKSYLELQLVAQIDLVRLSYPSGADMTLAAVSNIGEYIFQNYTNYDGFVVIHSIDNVLYTANLLAFTLTSLGKPIVFTGASIPSQFFQVSGNVSSTELSLFQEMSLRTSLVTAVQLATLDCSGILLAYGSNIVQAVRAAETNIPDQTGFQAWPGGEVAKVHFGIELAGHPLIRKNTTPKYQRDYNQQVYIAQRQPELTIPLLPDTAAALIIPAYQERLLPTALQLPTRPTTIIIGRLSHQMDLPKSAIILPPLPPITAHIKIMVGLARYAEPAALKQYLTTNQLGEFGHL